MSAIVGRRATGSTQRAARRVVPGAVIAVLGLAVSGMLAACASGSGGPGGSTGDAVRTGATGTPTTGSGSPGAEGAAPAGGPGGIGKLRSVLAGVPGTATRAPASSTLTVPPGGLLMFVTPSKNIGCGMTATEVRCDINERNWTPPAKPASCEFDYGQGLSVGDGEAGFVCAGDTVLGGPVVLDYGLVAQDGEIQCLSSPEGVTCRNLRTGRGFTLSREAYTVF